MKRKTKTRAPRQKAAKLSPATMAQYRKGLGSLPVLRHVVESKKTLASQREVIKGIGGASQGESTKYADLVMQSLSRVAAPIDFLQHFVPKGNVDDLALSVIETVVLQNIERLLDEVETISTASILLGYELAFNSASSGKMKPFQRRQAEIARTARAKKIAESPDEQLLNKAIEVYLGSRTSGSLYKDAGSILSDVNEMLVTGGFKEVSQDKIHYRLKKRGTL